MVNVTLIKIKENLYVGRDLRIFTPRRNPWIAQGGCLRDLPVPCTDPTLISLLWIARQVALYMIGELSR